MANFTYLENAHVFSKAPVQLSMEASSAVNKSAHTIQSDEVWGEVCPFITTNDVSGLTKDTLFEIEGYAPVKFNYKKPAIELDAINNNGMKSNGYVAKVIINGKPVTQFIADTDVTNENGTLASGYRAVLYDKNDEEVPDSKYTINYSNGLIYFKDPIESTTESHYTLSFFTYEGKKLSSSINDINSSITEISNDVSGLQNTVSAHTKDKNIHITSAERKNWNKSILNAIGDTFINIDKTVNEDKENTINVSLNSANEIADNTYTINYPHTGEDANQYNYQFLHLRNKGYKNGYLKSLIINEIKEEGAFVDSNNLKLYAHVYKFTDTDITSGAAERKEYIASFRAYYIKDSNAIRINFKNNLEISDIYNYDIIFSNGEALKTGNDGNEVKLKYNYVSAVGNNSKNPRLVTTYISENSLEIADIVYFVPCKMDIEEFTIPTTQAVYDALEETNNNITHEYSVDYTKASGDFTLFVLPNDPTYYPIDTEFNAIKLETLNIAKNLPVKVYLGVVAWYSDGSKKLLSVSDNANPSSTAGSFIWKFSTPFKFEKDYKLAFYVLESKDDFVGPEPIRKPKVELSAYARKSAIDPNTNWNEAVSNLTAGFIVQYTTTTAGNAWDEWPACTLYANHMDNSKIHVSTDDRERWDKKTTQVSFPAEYSNIDVHPLYVTTYGFEYQTIGENMWVQNIEVNVVLPEERDNFTQYIAQDAPANIIPAEINEKVCKILVAEGLSNNYAPNFNPEIDEKILGISEYNICKHDKNGSVSNVLNFAFEKPVFLESGKNYRFYFYDQNENLYALPIIVNVDNADNISVNRKEIATRYLVTRYDYYGVWGIRNYIPDPYGPYGLKVKLSRGIHSAFVAHNSNNNIHVSAEERDLWNKGGNMTINGDNFITPTQDESTWNISLNTVNSLDNINNTNGVANVPTSDAVKTYVDSHVIDPTSYIFNDLPGEERKYYMIFDAWQNPVYISDDFKKELTTGNRLFDYRSWEKFHIDMPYLETQSQRMFHNNLNLMSFKSDLSSLIKYTGFFHGDVNLQYVDIVLTDKALTDGSNCFNGCNKLKYVKITCNNLTTINTFLSYLPANTNVKNKKLIIGKIENGKFKKYYLNEVAGNTLNNLIEAGWSFNN